MKPRALTIVLASAFLSACASTGTFTGVVKDTAGKPVPEVSVQFWQNQWVPFSLPKRIATTYTDTGGIYAIEVEENVSFIVVEDKSITFSEYAKTNRGDGKHYHEFKVPQI